MQNTLSRSYQFWADESEQNTLSVRFDHIGALGKQIFGTERQENGKLCIDGKTGTRVAALLDAAVPDLYKTQMQHALSEHLASGGTADLTHPVRFLVTSPSEIPTGTAVPYGSFCVSLESALVSDQETFDQALSDIRTHRDCLPLRIAGARNPVSQPSTTALEQLPWTVLSTRPDGGYWGSDTYVPASGATKRFVQAAHDCLVSCATGSPEPESVVAKVMQQTKIIWGLEDPQISGFSSDRSLRPHDGF